VILNLLGRSLQAIARCSPGTDLDRDRVGAELRRLDRTSARESTRALDGNNAQPRAISR
jgi:hypothetical protein